MRASIREALSVSRAASQWAIKQDNPCLSPTDSHCHLWAGERTNDDRLAIPGTDQAEMHSG